MTSCEPRVTHHKLYIMALLLFVLFLFSACIPSICADGESEIMESCATPGPIKHGQVMTWGDNLLVEYICDEGFFPLGDVFGACIEEEGIWTISPPICVAKGCKKPTPPAYGYVSMDVDGQIAKFSCGRSHYLIGEKRIYCEGKNWSHLPPKCVGPGSKNLLSKKLMLRNDTKDVTEKLKPTINFTAEILHTDSTCNRHHRYRTPTAIPHGGATTQYTYNRHRRTWVIIANYTCHEGYHLENNQTRYLFCRNFKWTSPVPPKCVKDRINPCLIDNGNCSQVCVQGDGQDFICDCYRGYGLIEDGKTCIDRNECVNENGGCEHHCRNTVGSRFCLCRKGYAAVGNVCFEIQSPGL